MEAMDLAQLLRDVIEQFEAIKSASQVLGHRPMSSGASRRRCTIWMWKS